MIACNYSKDKTAYIPIVTWGKCARNSGKYAIGTPVSISGRIQSRIYTKEIDGFSRPFIVYELSANEIKTIESN